MHQNLGYLFVAFAVTWAGLFGYVFMVQRALAQTNARLRELEGGLVDEERSERGGRV